MWAEMTSKRRHRATHVHDTIQKAIDRWVAEYRRDMKRRTPAEVWSHAAALLAHARALMGRHAVRGEHWNPSTPKHGRGKSSRSLVLIEAASTILREIQPASIRAVCYRLFTTGHIASMAKSQTNRVSAQLTWAREQGLIPWSWIVDETREAERVNAWQDPAAYVETVKRAYRRDRWADQPQWVEVWSEKGTVRGTLAPVLEEFGVTFRVMHGYASATALYAAARETCGTDKLLTITYVGDWDPSGLHMSEVDLTRRLLRYGGNIHVVRLALTEQDTRAGLPSFPANTKCRDPRYRWYVDRYGSRCWELDALSPVILRDRVEAAIVDRLDLNAWQRAAVAEAAERDSLTSILSQWPGISGQASKHPADHGGQS
jgi:hypothetical protein